jgi:hypothetical protein
MSKNIKSLDPIVLDQFTGTEHWYRHGLARNVTYTDGVKYVAEQAGAYWLIDIIAIAQKLDAKCCREPFQHWTIDVQDDASAVVVGDDGNGNQLYRQAVAWTDFPSKRFEFYCCEDRTSPDINRVIMLTSEY